MRKNVAHVVKNKDGKFLVLGPGIVFAWYKKHGPAHTKCREINRFLNRYFRRFVEDQTVASIVIEAARAVSSDWCVPKIMALQRAFDLYDDRELRCPECKGVGKIDGKICIRCEGTGRRK